MFIVLEIQESAFGATPAVLTFISETKNEALSKWHEILKFAAVSTLYRHTAIVLTTEGKTLARESYVHVTEESEEA